MTPLKLCQKISKSVEKVELLYIGDVTVNAVPCGVHSLLLLFYMHALVITATKTFVYGLFSKTDWVSRHQKGKPFWD